MESVWDSRPTIEYIVATPSGEWQPAASERVIVQGASTSLAAPKIVTVNAIETALTYVVDPQAARLDKLTVTSALGQYARSFFGIQAIDAGIEVRVLDFVWADGEVPQAGPPHRRAVHFGPVAVDRTGADNSYRLAPLWLEATDSQSIPAGRQSVWMLQWWVGPEHPAGAWNGELSIEYRTALDPAWRRLAFPVTLQVLPIQLESLPPDSARYGVWYGPTWLHTSELSYQSHFQDMREAGVNALGLMNVTAYNFRYEFGRFQFTPGRVEDAARRFRDAVPTGNLFVDLRMVTGYASLFGRIASTLQAEGKPLPDVVQLTADQVGGDPYSVVPAENQWTESAYTAFAQGMKTIMDTLPGEADVYYFPQEEPSNATPRPQIMQYFAPLTAKAGLPVVLVTNAGHSGGDDAVGIESAISLVSTNWFDEASIASWRNSAVPIELYNIEGNLRLTAGFFLEHFPAPVRGLTIWAYQFGHPLRDADTGRAGVYAPVHFLTYPGDRGPVPTLRWVNFSEGITDRRYAYTAKVRINRLLESGADVKGAVDELTSLESSVRRLVGRDLHSYNEAAADMEAADLDQLRRRYLRILMMAAAHEANSSP